MATFLGIPLDRFKWAGKKPKTYASSLGAVGSFCHNRETPMAFHAERYKDEIHLYAAASAHAKAFEPKFHVHWAERLLWLHPNDGLLRFGAFAKANPLQ